MAQIVARTMRDLFTKAARRILSAEHRAAIAGQMRQWEQGRYRFSPVYTTNQIRLGELQNKHRGETCVIIGNGPSMRGFDLEKLAGVKCFCLNRGYLMWHEQEREPDFLVAVNELVLEQFSAELALSGRCRFVPWDAQGMFAGVPETCFIKTLWQPRFHTDVRTGAWGGGTVTFTAMQLAYHMGFSRVVLLGVDHIFQHDGSPNELLVATTGDPNHFDSVYFGPGTRWNAPDLATSERAYWMAKRAFEADGREIIDATVGGKLRIFRRVDNWDFHKG
ncbi:6-hydroxymethylpterin diphosphokinase MptE-like protein [Mesorhizobium sp. DCY119]|uniref:6-hydroxymethylpterin diphosphokinase MptE-like protein n=1 Tax=Mesorhizobium sp. DCY119 TaxID=2108445 RepID=UPI000E7585AA|nr:6-hydroxymethylpterin diphosphokinase MptE-like protein [Mesorhizobium sp. DCY119]RJG40887.1 DUF115 domain-containing protein [Mesorhizobium sp. DCY119]